MKFFQSPGDPYRNKKHCNMKNNLLGHAALLVATVLLSTSFWSCSKDEDPNLDSEPTPTAIAVTGVTLNKTGITLHARGGRQRNFDSYRGSGRCHEQGGDVEQRQAGNRHRGCQRQGHGCEGWRSHHHRHHRGRRQDCHLQGDGRGRNHSGYGCNAQQDGTHARGARSRWTAAKL